MLYSVIGGLFVFAILKGGSLQAIWSLIRTMQLIFLCTIVSIPYPAEAYMIFQGEAFFKLDLMQG